MPRAQLLRFAVALTLVSVGGALFAVIFRLALDQALAFLYGANSVLEAVRSLPIPAKLLAPAIGGLLAGLCARWATRRRGGGGVGEVMEAVVLGRGRISVRATLIKAVGSWFAILGGGSIGREGPLIQFGGGLGGALSRAFDLGGTSHRALVAAGTAAGFAAAYNTPLAALLFVTEVVTGVIALDILLPTTIAVPIATAVTRALVGAGPIYGNRAFAMLSIGELGVYLGLGLLAGLIGVGFIAILGLGERAFAKAPLPQPYQAAVGGLIVGAIIVLMPEVAGNGYETINLILDGRLALIALIPLILGKAVATTCSVSSGAPGGVFTPTLLLGAALGAASGHALTVIAPHWAAPPGAYALVGMAALCAATTHAPLMAAVLVFELSGDYAIVLPLLVATGASTFVARLLGRQSLYEAELKRRGLVWEETVGGRRVVGFGEPQKPG
ncbi:MAG: chloride channel protein [Myxococcota bacterium]